MTVQEWEKLLLPHHYASEKLIEVFGAKLTLN